MRNLNSIVPIGAQRISGRQSGTKLLCGKGTERVDAELIIERHNIMINFEEELKKFRPSLEIEDAEESIYNQDLTDMADLLVRMIQESQMTEEQ